MEARETEIGATTGLVGLFGHPVRHSLSPRMHNAAFRLQGLDLVYLAFDVLPGDLARALDALRALGMRGANLTVPHKEAVLPLLDRVDALAARVGAVNTIVNEQGVLTGYNTDVAGFREALRVVLPEGAHDRRCLVIGAGGAARAVLAALAVEEAAVVSVYNRNPERAVSLCDVAGTWGATDCRPVAGEALDSAARAADLIVNATPVGLGGPVKELPIPVDTLHSGHVVVDLAYCRGNTALVEAANARGAVAIDGKEMLVKQAALAYRLWTGVQPPVDAMRASAEHGER